MAAASVEPGSVVGLLVPSWCHSGPVDDTEDFHGLGGSAGDKAGEGGLQLTQQHFDVLRAVRDLQEDGRAANGGGDLEDFFPPASQVGQRLLEIYKARAQATGTPYQWFDRPPWHGTDPMAGELRHAGLLQVDPGIATARHAGRPAGWVDDYWLGLTDGGRQTLAAHQADPRGSG